MNVLDSKALAALQAKTETAAVKPARSLEQEKQRLLKAAKEFESFFKYYMMKTMRETIPKDGLSEDLPLGNEGQDAFTDMFDMELSKSGTGGHGSISDVIYRSLEKNVEARFSAENRTTSSSVNDLPHLMPLTHKQAEAITLHPTKPVPARQETKPIPIQRQSLVSPHQPQAQSLPKPHEQSQIKATEPAREPSGLQQLRDQILRVVPKRQEPSVSEHFELLKSVSPYSEHIAAAARDTSLSANLIASVIQAESGGDANAVSKAGAKGLMQLADGTAADLGVTDVFDPAENILAGSRYLKKLMDRYQDEKIALAAYNAGPGNVDKYGGIPPFKETKAYVAKVTDLAQSGSVSRVTTPKGTVKTSDTVKR